MEQGREPPFVKVENGKSYCDCHLIDTHGNSRTPRREGKDQTSVQTVFTRNLKTAYEKT